ncbi:hypothetical protein [Phaeobacter inhibens]|uniref:hypothetical protein n=1 Tax=Phaeobacter inhibens TaxID=221822 RepID=UPI001A7E07D2|nr:hypothetical protein [Phaeobacter inhibens]
MKSILVLASVSLMALSACVDSEKAAMRRASLIAQIFPNSADRTGIHLAFPVGSLLEIIYFKNEVSSNAIDRRVAGYCERIGKPVLTVYKAPKASVATLANGTQRPATTIWYDCD